jgi:hypothetical protein
MTTTNYDSVKFYAAVDVQVLIEKGKTYGDSWKSRGGVGAFMMLARKWDRIENIAKAAGWDILEAGKQNTGDVLDDIADLRRYLLLVETEARARAPKRAAAVKYDPLSDSDDTEAGPGPSYVNQG